MMAKFDEDAATQRVAQSVAAMTAGWVVKLIEEAERRGAENALRAAAAGSSDREYRRMMAAAMTDDLEGDGFGLDQ